MTSPLVSAIRFKSAGILALAFLPFAALCLALTLCPRRPLVGPNWTPKRLCEEVRRAGLDYEVKATGPFGAWCLRVRGNDTSWEEIARGVPMHVFSRPGCVRVLYLPAYSNPRGSVGEGQLLLGPLYLLGHPNDLRRIASTVGP
jgi:hypothetical protein